MKAGESMLYLSEKSKALTELQKVVERVRNIQIKSIFTFDSPSWNNHFGYRRYMQRDEVYILFKSGMCLVIYYPFVDSFGFEFRELSEEEQKLYKEIKIKDVFNTSNDIYDSFTSKKIRNHTCSLEYACIKEINLRSVTSSYEKWTDDDIDFVEPTSETFDQIKFIMDNGKSFVICAEDASSNGYVNFWSEDSKETITEFEVEK